MRSQYIWGGKMSVSQSKVMGKKDKRPFILASIVLAMFMAAIEATIIATALPSIIGDLGGFALLSWVFSAYLLMQAITIPVYGKLADLFGRKPVFIFGIVVFMVGSILCGFAQSIHMLILFRLIQGFGAGAVMPIATTIVGDIYTLEERAKIQGYLASVWGISSIVGPLLGGFIVEYLHWSWVFWVNIPLGILAIVGILTFLHEELEKKKRSIDYIGASLFFVAISSLMLLLIQGGVTWSWNSAPVIFLIIIFGCSLPLFIWQEKRAPEPLMPLGIWKDRLIAVSNIASLMTGAILIGVSSFLPTFVQGVMKQPPIVAGFTLATMSIGWPIAATVAGRIYLKIGFRTTAILGGVSLLIGALFFVTLQPSYGPVWAGVGSFFIGVGMGLTTTTFVVSIQSSVDWKTRGVATAANMFMRILGSMIGVALLGGILNSRMSTYLSNKGVNLELSLDLDITHMLLDPEQRGKLTPDALQVLRDGLSVSLHTVYWGVFILAILCFVLILNLPKRKIDTNKEN
jgi:EmrB/QacA subfamily drug resistance transporter